MSSCASFLWPAGKWGIRARFLSLTGSKLRLCSANHRTGYFSNLACDWLSIVWTYSEQETENGPCSAKLKRHQRQWNYTLFKGVIKNRICYLIWCIYWGHSLDLTPRHLEPTILGLKTFILYTLQLANHLGKILLRQVPNFRAIWKLNTVIMPLKLMMIYLNRQHKMFVLQLFHANIKENIKSPHCCSFSRWIHHWPPLPLTKGQQGGNLFPCHDITRDKQVVCLITATTKV